MTRAALLIFGGLLAVSAALAAPAVNLFSSSLTPADRTACGVDRLSAPQVATLDALVRRQSALMASWGVAPASSSSHAPSFSKSLEPAEVHGAGLDRLTPAQVARLDGLVSRWVAADTTLVGAGTAVTTRAYPDGAKTSIAWNKPEIHGVVTLEIGAGSGGYSERTEAIDMNYTDPAHRLSIDFGMANTDVKWGNSGGDAPGYPNPFR